MTITLNRTAGTAGTVSTPPPSRFTGTGALLRLALRRDRYLLPALILSFAGVVAVSVAATIDLYPDEQARLQASAAINSTATLVALYGKVYAPTSLGALSLIKLTAFGAATVAVAFVLLTVRHTRTEEESGRVELVASGAVGRSSPLAAALLLGLLTSTVLGVVTTSGLLLVGMDIPGSLAFGLSWTVSGLVFTAATAVCAQLTVSHRTAIGLGLSIVAVAYVLRALGDLTEGDPGWLSWLSPIGWSQQIRPFAGDRWWVAAVSLLVALALVPLAFALRSRRDLGSGVLQERLGPGRGRLRTTMGLAWRLHRGALLAWAVGVLVFGLVLGSAAQGVAGLLDSAAVQQFITLLGGEQALVNAFLAAEVAILGLIIAGYGMATVLRAHNEERSGRVELLVSDSRQSFAWSHLGFALVATAALIIMGAAAIGVGYGVATGEGLSPLGSLAWAGVAHVPAAWVMCGIGFALWGVDPRTIPATWILLITFIVIGEFGSLWGLPTWVLDVSPFAHSPTLPGGPVDAGAVAGLVIVAGLLTALGSAAWQRRDLRL